MLNMRYQKHGKVTPLKWMETIIADFDGKAVSIWLPLQKHEIRIGMRQRENEGKSFVFLSHTVASRAKIYIFATLNL